VSRDPFDLMPLPGERDLPPGRLEERRAALLAAIEGERPSRVRGWLASVGLLLASLAIVASVLLAGSVRPPASDVTAKTVVVLAGGSGLVALTLVPRPVRPAG
jgi:hypothetical protein